MQFFEILKIINLAHYFGSAFNLHQVWRLLPIPIAWETLAEIVRQLKNRALIQEREGRLFAAKYRYSPLYRRKQLYSRRLFNRHRKLLTLIANFPFVRFMGLSGANAFESCKADDDIDLFIVTRRNCLWLTYLLLVIFLKLCGKRKIFCINYLIDEDHLKISHQNYYTAVQLAQMIPLAGLEYIPQIIRENRWVYQYLPNVNPMLLPVPFYLLQPESGEIFGWDGRTHFSDKRHRRTNFSVFRDRPLQEVNRLVYRLYRRRLLKKFGNCFGRGIVLSEGVAKLNTYDYQDLYQQIFQEMALERIA